MPCRILRSERSSYPHADNNIIRANTYAEPARHLSIRPYVF